MTLNELYRILGSEYGEVLSGLKSETLIKNLICAFPDDQSYSNLCIALKYGDAEGAGRAAESLLGICGNLGFKSLEKSVRTVASALKGGCSAVTGSMLSHLGSDYELTVFLVQKFTGKN